MKKVLFFVLVCISTNLFAQKYSIGVGGSILDMEHRVNGLYFNGNIRAQFTKTFGWQTEVGYATTKDRITMTETGMSQLGQVFVMNTVNVEEGIKSMILKSALTTKLVGEEGFRAEMIIGGGMYKQSDEKIYGLLSCELYLSVPIGNKLAIGMPVSYNYITSRRVRFVTAGLSLRYLL